MTWRRAAERELEKVKTTLHEQGSRHKINVNGEDL